MNSEQLTVFDDVLVHAVTCHGTTIDVDLYGGPSNVCGSVRFSFPDARERIRSRRLLQEWSRRQLPLTLISRGSTVTLQNTAARLRAELESR